MSGGVVEWLTRQTSNLRVASRMGSKTFRERERERERGRGRGRGDKSTFFVSVNNTSYTTEFTSFCTFIYLTQEN